MRKDSIRDMERRTTERKSESEGTAPGGVGGAEYSPPLEVRNAPADSGLATLDVGGIEVPWCAAPGEGTPVVILAGLGWRATGSVRSHYAGRGLPLVALDYPRRWPRSRLDSVPALARLYREALERLGLPRVRLLGVSLGGMVALRLALDEPELVESLALVSTAAAGARVAGRWRLPLSRGVAGLLPSESFYAFYRRWGPVLVGTELFGPTRDGARLWTDPMGRRKMVDLLSAAAGFDERPRLGSIRTPALVLHGTRDLVFESRSGIELGRGIPRARVALVEGAGHFAFLTHRRRVLEELMQFWSEASLS